MARWWAAVFLLWVTAVAPNTAWAAARVALVMGNSDYREADGWSPLPSIAADVTAMTAALRDLGFDVTVKTNLTRDGMLDAVLEFKDRVGHGIAETAVVYFSGHGMRVGGGNYLVPLGANIAGQREEKQKERLFDVDYIWRHIGEAPGRLNLLFLDACRSDPNVKGRGVKGATTSIGFEKVLPPDAGGTVVSYAARAGSAAFVGVEKQATSNYTTALIENLRLPGLTLATVLANTELRVRELSKGEQNPSSEGSDALKLTVLRPALSSPRDDTAWAEARRAGTIAGYREYVARFPKGMHLAEAAVEMAKLPTVGGSNGSLSSVAPVTSDTGILSHVQNDTPPSSSHEISPPSQEETDKKNDTLNHSMELISGTSFENMNKWKIKWSGWSEEEWGTGLGNANEMIKSGGCIRFFATNTNDQIGIIQDINRVVSSFRKLVLSSTVIVSQQKLDGTGWQGREAPVGIFVSYIDNKDTRHNELLIHKSSYYIGESQKKRVYWHGFFYKYGDPLSMDIYGSRVDRGVTANFSVDLMKELSPPPKFIISVGAMGSGWPPRDGTVCRISLLGSS